MFEEDFDIIAALKGQVTQVFYMDRKPKFRIFCGSN